MDKVLKQRLAGATILIALAVIFVPMLFEEPETVDQVQGLSMDIPTPPPGRGEIRRLPLDPARVAQVAPQTAADPAPEPEMPMTSNEESMASDLPMQPDPDQAAPVESESEAPTESLPAASENDAADDMETPSAPLAEPDPVPEPAPEEPSGSSVAEGGWIVQVASFSSVETAERIKTRLEQLGHAADRELLVRGQTTLHRVWTGPYADRSVAERARSQIAATVADVDPVVRANRTDAAASTDGGQGPVFSVQVGVFAEQANAQRQTDQLLGQGFEAFIYHDRSGTRPVWRVRVGRYDGRDQAEALLQRLSAEASLEGLIVTHP